MSQVNVQGVPSTPPTSCSQPCAAEPNRGRCRCHEAGGCQCHEGGCRCQNPQVALATEQDRPLRDALREFERQHILASLRRNGYDKTQTARALGIGLSSLYRKLEELDIPKNPAEPGHGSDPARDN